MAATPISAAPVNAASSVTVKGVTAENAVSPQRARCHPLGVTPEGAVCPPLGVTPQSPRSHPCTASRIPGVDRIGAVGTAAVPVLRDGWKFGNRALQVAVTAPILRLS